MILFEEMDPDYRWILPPPSKETINLSSSASRAEE